MITAVDTSIIIDVLIADPQYGSRSAEVLRRCRDEGRLLACEIVWAEVSAAYSNSEAASDVLARIGLEFSAADSRAALQAGQAWRRYRRRGGPRDRLIADFVIGAHAAVQAERLLTRDRGFYRTYFKGLEIVDPQ